MHKVRSTKTAREQKRIREVGLRLYESMSDLPSIFDKRRWMGRLMDRTMRDEEFRLDLFRYVDALPSLKSDALVEGLRPSADHREMPPTFHQAKKEICRVNAEFRL